jgi:bifunctional ADP-heptose synthase (sugar kinase/adenylyltransferase)
MLTDELIERILSRLPALTIGVLGDLFLDRYLDIDAALTERSIETDIDAFQVARIRSTPGALGTIINNLTALGVGKIRAVSIIGDDGEGYELRQELAKRPSVDTRWVLSTPGRRTPTYTKPMLHEASQPARELNRLDIKNRTPMPEPLQDFVLEGLNDIWRSVDALIVLDQVSEAGCGVVSERIRREVAQLGERQPDKFVLADSREWIGFFRSVSLKPNRRECDDAVYGIGGISELLGEPAALQLSAQCGRPVFCTLGERGILLARPDGKGMPTSLVIPSYPVTGPIDIVGAGDSTSAGITCAMAAGTSPEVAAAFGCLIASITIQQIGTTGTASPEQVRQRWRQVRGAQGEVIR